MNVLKTSLIFCLFAIAFSQATIAQIKDQSKIITEYDSIRAIAPREKVYVHFDKNTYLPQDTIWFKAYLLDATLLSYSSISGLIYTDIINSSAEVVETLSLPTSMGLTWGAYALDEEKYPPGKYTFRAYTNWMQNFGKTHIFTKEFIVLKEELPQTNIQIGAAMTPEQKLKSATNRRTAKSEIDIQFLPEGGTLLSDIRQKMAFKAIDRSGKGIEVNGEILDAKQNLVANFKSNHLGMGTFLILPKSGETYTAKFSIAGNSFTKDLPKPKQLASTIKLANDLDHDSLSITVFSNLPDQALTVLGQARGVLCFIAPVNANQPKTTIKVARNIFPTGVAQIILMDEQKKLLNERNFFVDLDNQLEVNTTSPHLTYSVRDSIPLQLAVKDFQGNPISASFSVAVTDDQQINKDTLNDGHILSYLLLTSDLKGEIEKPGYYFNAKNEQKATDLDALMLTQGWVSYDWDTHKKPLFKADQDYRISGRVTNMLNKPVVNAKITLFGKSKFTLMMDTLTNDNGEFVFNQLPVIDSASFMIQALNAKGKSGTLGIEVEPFVRPAIPLTKKRDPIFEEELDTTSMAQISAKKQVYQAALKSGIVLREVKITGKKVITGSKNINGPGEASQIITEQNLAPIYKKSLFDVLREKVSGFMVGTRKKTPIRDFFVRFDYARFIFDGVELDAFYTPSGGIEDINDYYNYVKVYLDYYNAEDIKGIEVLSNGYSSRYKSRYKDPMDLNTYTFFEITTKTGAGPFLKKSANVFLLKPVNYGNTKVFYSPKYANKTASNSVPDYRSTIYWNPNVLTDLNGEATTSFFSGDKKGTYTVWVEGTDTKGSFGVSTLKLTIK